VLDKDLDQIEISSLLGRLVNKLRDFRGNYDAILDDFEACGSALGPSNKSG
jgi:hypothetical protein